MMGFFRKYFNAETLYGPALIMLIATVVGGGCNYLFQFFMVRSLENGAYAELNSLLAILYIIAIPAATVQNVLIRYVSKYKAKGMEGAISWIIRRTFAMLFLAALLISSAILLLAPQIEAFLTLSSTLPVAILSIGIFLALITPVGVGPLQGLQRFTILGIQGIGNYLTKLSMGIVFVVAGFGLAGALGGVVVGFALGAAIAFIAIRKYLFTRGEGAESGEIWRYTFPVMMGVLCFTILTNVDVVLATHFFPDEADAFATASMLAKIILFLPGAIAIVMFPKISHAHARESETSKILIRSIQLTVLLSGILVLAYLIFPEQIIYLYAKNYTEAAPILQVMGVAMMFFGIANLFMLYGLATDGHAYIVIMFLSTVLLGGLLGVLLALQIVITPLLLAITFLATSMFICALSGFYLILIEREKAMMFGSRSINK